MMAALNALKGCAGDDSCILVTSSEWRSFLFRLGRKMPGIVSDTQLEVMSQ